MFDPTLTIRRAHRRGALAPMFAVLLPLLLIFAGFAVNLAYMQMCSTELKVATDAACHAGGRAMSLRQITAGSGVSTEDAIRQSIENTMEQARITAQANRVAGKVLSVGPGEDNDIQLIFGRSVRQNNGYGMYQFSEIPMSEIMSGSQRPSSIAVVGNMQLPLAFRMMNYHEFTQTGGNPKGSKISFDFEEKGKGVVKAGLGEFSPSRRSIATQVDRDISLVLDRSGSMLWYKDENALEDRLYDLYTSYETYQEEGYWEYRFWKYSWWYGGWRSVGYHRWGHQPYNSYIFDYNDKRWHNGDTYQRRRISWNEYQDATDWLYNRQYSNNVIYQLEAWTNSNHTLGDSYSSSENSKLTDEMAKYCHDWKYVAGAPRYSRAYYMALGVNAFLDVLDNTDQEEHVALVTFNNQATLDIELATNFQPIRNAVGSLDPYGGTAIGDGMLTGTPPIISGSAARPFAAKTIVVLTDGDSNSGADPNSAATQIVSANNVTIHTVTFTSGANQAPMQTVAELGQGRHYHADSGEGLVEIFEEIANNLPTILTE